MNTEHIPSNRTDADDVVWQLLRILWRRALPIAAFGLLIGAVAVGGSYLIQPQYRASSVLLPQTGSGSAGLLAALGNFANIPIQGEQSLEDLYPVIVESNRILDTIVEGDWPYGDGRASLFEVYGVEAAASPTDSLRAARRLKKHLRERAVALSRDKGTGIMELAVTTPGDPRLAALLANTLTDSLSAFIEEFNAAKTSQRLYYIQRRLDDVATDLGAAESRLAQFKEDNRAYAASPRLQQQAAEQERQVQALTVVWVELIKQLEIAKLDDNKEQFSLEVLDRAQPPLHKSRPRRANMGIVGAILGGLAASLFVLGRALAGTKAS